jgi:hypothetical protein
MQAGVQSGEKTTTRGSNALSGEFRGESNKERPLGGRSGAGGRAREPVTWRRDAHLPFRHCSVVPAKVHGAREAAAAGEPCERNRRPRGQPLASLAWRPHQNRKRASKRDVPACVSAPYWKVDMRRTMFSDGKINRFVGLSRSCCVRGCLCAVGLAPPGRIRDGQAGATACDGNGDDPRGNPGVVDQFPRDGPRLGVAWIRRWEEEAAWMRVWSPGKRSGPPVVSPVLRLARRAAQAAASWMETNGPRAKAPLPWQFRGKAIGAG